MRRSVRDRRRPAEAGTATVEYVVLLTLVSLVVAVAVAGLALPLIAHFRWVQMLINLPFP